MLENNWGWHIGTSYTWYGLGLLGIFAWSSNGGELSVMAGHGYQWTKLTITMDASESKRRWCVWIDAITVVIRWSHNAFCIHIIESRVFDIARVYCTHFSPAKWGRKRKKTTIFLHITGNASVAYLCVCHIQFGILQEKPCCICQNLWETANKLNAHHPIILSKQCNIH